MYSTLMCSAPDPPLTRHWRVCPNWKVGQDTLVLGAKGRKSVISEQQLFIDTCFAGAVKARG